jgi:hypothetical protein
MTNVASCWPTAFRELRELFKSAEAASEWRSMVRFTICSVFTAGCIAISTSAALADTLMIVGPGGKYPTISKAVDDANLDPNLDTYYIVEVIPGTYTDDFPHVTRPMTIRVDHRYTDQQVLLKATEEVPNRKGIILTEASLTVDGLTFIGAKIANSLGGNAAGIRDQSTTGPVRLTVRNSKFIENQNGILTGANPEEAITVENSIFKSNGNATITEPPFCCQHALYVGQVGSLTVRNSLFCGQLVGHDIKSRALMTSVLNNMLYDGAPNFVLGCTAGSTSFAIDVPNGGVVRISGNQIIQGGETGNSSLVAYGEEGLRYGNNHVDVSGNIFKSSGVTEATGIYDPNCITVRLRSNTFSGIKTIMDPPRCAAQQ